MTQQKTPTLKLCWKSGRNIIVSLEYPHGQKHDPDIRGGITYYYGKSMDPEEIKSKLDHYLADEKRHNSKFLQDSLYYKVFWITAFTKPHHVTVLCSAVLFHMVMHVHYHLKRVLHSTHLWDY